MTVNVLILAAGQSQLDETGRDTPLCLIEHGGVSLLERIVLSVQGISETRFTVAILEKDARKFHLNKVASLLIPGVRVVRIPEGTRGAACTALLASIHMEQDAELLIISANEIVDAELSAVVDSFRSRNLDGGTLIFKSLNPRFAYVRLDENGLVEETAALTPISRTATAGTFWFRRTDEFVAAAQNMIRKDAHINGNFYVAPAFNELILRQARVGVYELAPEKYMPLKTEQQVRLYESGSST